MFQFNNLNFSTFAVCLLLNLDLNFLFSTSNMMLYSFNPLMTLNGPSTIESSMIYIQTPFHPIPFAQIKRHLNPCNIPAFAVHDSYRLINGYILSLFCVTSTKPSLSLPDIKKILPLKCRHLHNGNATYKAIKARSSCGKNTL